MIRRFLLALIALAAAALVLAPFAHAQPARKTQTRAIVRDSACAPAVGWVARDTTYRTMTEATNAAKVKKTCPAPPPVVVVPPVVVPLAPNQLPNVPGMIGQYGQPAVWTVPLGGPGSQGSGAADVFTVGEVSPLSGDGSGNFRTTCQFAKFGVFDPLIYPGRDTIGHLHQFFGNVSITPQSTSPSLASSGASTCAGGTLNRSVYWSPAMYNSATGQVIAPSEGKFYYKSSYNDNPAEIQPIPAGLHLIGGDPMATGSQAGYPSYAVHWFCTSGTPAEPPDGTIPRCAVGDQVELWVGFPQCWDGKSLDSPDHRSHMATLIYRNPPQVSTCPASHPVHLPGIQTIFIWPVLAGQDVSQWRLSCDMGAQKPGQCAHSDDFFGWDVPTQTAFVRGCINARKDCGVNGLGDGRRLGYLGKLFWP